MYLVFLTQNLNSFVHFYNFFCICSDKIRVMTYHNYCRIFIDATYSVVHKCLKVIIHEVVGFVKYKYFGA